MSVYVGIEVHRKRSQVAVVDEAGAVQVNRNVPNGVAARRWSRGGRAGLRAGTLRGWHRLRRPRWVGRMRLHPLRPATQDMPLLGRSCQPAIAPPRVYGGARRDLRRQCSRGVLIDWKREVPAARPRIRIGIGRWRVRPAAPGGRSCSGSLLPIPRRPVAGRRSPPRCGGGRPRGAGRTPRGGACAGRCARG